MILGFLLIPLDFGLVAALPSWPLPGRAGVAHLNREGELTNDIT